jgi:hypothetical protein
MPDWSQTSGFSLLEVAFFAPFLAFLGAFALFF